QSLHAALALLVLRERDYDATAGLQVANERGRHVRGARAHDDRIDLEGLAEVRAAVAVCKAHVANLQGLQMPPGLVDERADALDRVHGLGDLREHRRLIAAAGADLEHAVERAP